MRSTLFSCLFFTIILVFFVQESISQSAKDVVERAENLLRGETSISEMVMKIVRPEWSRQVSMKTWSKGDNYSLIYINAPARDRGTTFLKRDQEIWQWVPSIQRNIKIPPSMMMQSWMGSDFTNDDLVRGASVVNDYSHEFLNDTLIDSSSVYRIKMIPKPDAPVVWEKLVVWITKETFIQRRVLFYDEDSTLTTVMVLSNVKEMDNREIPTLWEMIPTDKKGHKTSIQIESIRFNVPLENSFFSLQNMKSVR